MDVRISRLAVWIGAARIIDDVSLHAPAGTFIGLVGPNGSGKTTLLRALTRSIRPTEGEIRVGGDDVWRDLDARAAARRMALVAQHPPAEYEFTVEEIVALGRLPHQRLMARQSAGDRRIVRHALDRVGIGQLANRSITALSGGERQRVFVAQALAQEPQVLVLDEPTNHLDIAAQLDVLAIAGGLGITVLAALHDLNLAAAHCHRVAVLDRGRLVADGAPADVLTGDLIATVFGVSAHTAVHPLTGRPLLAFSRTADPTVASAATSPAVTPAPHPSGALT